MSTLIGAKTVRTLPANFMFRDPDWCQRGDRHNLRSENSHVVWLLIDLASMANGYHNYQQNPIINGVDNAMFTDSEPVTLTPPERS